MPETTNLKLYKKDPIAEKKTTFNIETMLNENWDKIDQAFGGIETFEITPPIPIEQRKKGKLYFVITDQNTTPTENIKVSPSISLKIEK